MINIEPTLVRRRALAAASALCLLAVPCGRAQPAASSDAASDDGETVVLSPFVVDSAADTGSYRAESTLAGSRVKTDLRDIGSALSVVTSQFLQDIGATNNQTLLQYTANTEVGGLQGNFGGLGNTGSLDETSALLRPSNNTRVRGLDSADNTRDYFLTDIPWDGYNVDRVEIQRGPNSILFGVGSPAGIINTGMAVASFKDANKFENRIGSYGSMRDVLDVNKVLLKDELSLRLIGLDDHTRYQQKPAFHNDQRIFAAVKYDPKQLNTGSAHTSINANFEAGRVRSNNPRTLPPVDAITPWFTTLNQQSYDPVTTWASNGAGTQGSASYQPYFNEAFVGRQYSGDPVFYYNADSTSPTLVQQAMTTSSGGLAANGTVDGGIDGLLFARSVAIAGYSGYALASDLPGGSKNIYKDKSLTDASIFDFYNNLIDGSNKHEWADWTAFNVNVVQTFFHNRLAFQAVFDHQKYSDGQESLLSGGQYVISVDVNSTLVDGTANPNFGRPYVANSGLYGNNSSAIERAAGRLTATGEIRGRDFLSNPLWASIVGRHVFTGLLSEDKKETDTRTWARYAMGVDYTDAIGESADITGGYRQVDWVTYLGPSLAGATSASGAYLSAVTAQQVPATTSVRYFDSTWAASTVPGTSGYVDPSAPYTYTQPDGTVNTTSTQSENPANYVGWTTKDFTVLNADKGDINQLYTSGLKQMNKIESSALTWQGYWWDDTLVSTLGYRRDTVSLAAATAPKDSVTNVALMDYDAGPVQSKQSGESKSLSLVLHLPKKLQAKLPWGSDLSFFFNNSQNFKADTARVDIEGRSIPNSTGRTREIGFVASTLDDRLSLKVNWYRTTVKNATLSGTGAGIGNTLYYLYLLEAWGTASAATDIAGLSGNSPSNAWYWDWATNDVGTPYNASRPFSTTDDPQGLGAAVDAKELAAAQSWMSQLPDQSFFDAYGLPIDVAKVQAGDYSGGFTGWSIGDGVGNIQPAYSGTIRGNAPVATVDTISTGVEFELTAQPVKNWNLTVNASRTSASRTNLSATLTDFIDYQKTVFDSEAGDLRLWGNSSQTLRQYWYQNIYYPYTFLVAQEGSSAPEIAPWHFNAVTNFTFDRGPLKGFNVGAGYRWQQSEILGYGITEDDSGNWNLDVNKPIRGSSQDAWDLWVGYDRKLTARIDWSIQLNVRNVGQSAHLVPISVQPDGSAGAYRIADGMGWQLTNTFRF